ncbi:MAG: Serine aminopeptidase [Actinomycetota bacterium]|nr:Serine aminopeptidase [Actinomycetota bacterium]
MTHRCVAVAPVGKAWMDAALPPALRRLLEIEVFVPASTSIDGIVDEVRSAITDDALVFGHSMNGALALAVASRVPVRGVIAVAAPPELPIAVAPDGRRWFDENVDTTSLDALMEVRFEWVMEVFANASAFDWEAARAAIDAPVLLVLGAHDGVVPTTMWPDARGVRHLTTVALDRSAHTPFVEQPDDFVAAVSRWLA